MTRARKARAKPEKRRDEIEWDFNSFPTYFGVAAGAFVATVFIAFGLYPVVFVVSLFAVSFCTTHVISRYFLRARGRREAARREEEERERRTLAARAAAETSASAEQPQSGQRRRRRR